MAAAIASTVTLLWFRRPHGVFTSVILSALWLWTGLIYHIIFFSAINPAAVLFGLFFILQSAILLLYGGLAGKLRFRITLSFGSAAGIAMIAYAIVIYPLLGLVMGQNYPRAPTFGTPCPTTIFTFGMLMFLESRPPIYVYVIPFLWSLIGSTAAILFGMYEDLGLFIAGAVGTVFLYFRK